MSRPVAFSYHRKAGMSSFDPSRMPAWLAEVWDGSWHSQPTRRWLDERSQRDIVGTRPARIWLTRTGRDRPSICTMTRPAWSDFGASSRTRRRTGWLKYDSPPPSAVHQLMAVL